jgi:REP element-mobilizing transposase RayT
VAHVPHDRDARRRAKEALNFPPVIFTGEQALTISKGFARAASEGEYRVYACSILPEHVHMVLGRNGRTAERMVGHLKAGATRSLADAGLHPFQNETRANGSRPSPWAENCWKVFLDSTTDVARAIKYVEENPVKEGKRRQTWSFVRD